MPASPSRSPAQRTSCATRAASSTGSSPRIRPTLPAASSRPRRRKAGAGRGSPAAGAVRYRRPIAGHSSICCACGTQFPRSAEPPPGCPICLDERQYIGADGQRWTTADELRAAHRGRLERIEDGLTGVGVEPSFAIGQRALLVERLLWDCVPLLDDALAAAVDARGGIATIAISHPHYYSAMVQWAERFDAKILLHEADREWIMHPSDRIELWSGERRRVSDALELIRLGGHFAGGTVCLWRDGAAGRGALLAGDIVQVVADHEWMSFMWSYPNMIPLPAREVERIRGVLEGLDFDRLYGAWWDRIVATDARAKTIRSADRYIDAVTRGRS